MTLPPSVWHAVTLCSYKCCMFLTEKDLLPFALICISVKFVFGEFKFKLWLGHLRTLKFEAAPALPWLAALAARAVPVWGSVHSAAGLLSALPLCLWFSIQCPKSTLHLHQYAALLQESCERAHEVVLLVLQLWGLAFRPWRSTCRVIKRKHPHTGDRDGHHWSDYTFKLSTV